MIDLLLIKCISMSILLTLLQIVHVQSGMLKQKKGLFHLLDRYAWQLKTYQKKFDWISVAFPSFLSKISSLLQNKKFSYKIWNIYWKELKFKLNHSIIIPVMIFRILSVIIFWIIPLVGLALDVVFFVTGILYHLHYFKYYM